MAGPLVIVESPAKAKKIQTFLGQDADVVSAPTVLASIGHVRDLARRAKELPAAVQKERWARLAIDTDNGFKAYYVVPENKKTVIAELKRALKDADSLYLATDEDREGEAIAWHLLEVLKPPRTMPVHRMVFHEITAPAIRDAFAHPRELNNRMVDAQETRAAPRPALRLRRVGGGLEEGQPWALGRPGPERRHAPRRRASSARSWPSCPPGTGTSRAPSRHLA